MSRQLEAIARIQADLEFLREDCDGPVEIPFSEGIVLVMPKAGTEDGLTVRRKGRGSVTVNYDFERLTVTVESKGGQILKKAVMNPIP